jgi:hypothetical protein
MIEGLVLRPRKIIAQMEPTPKESAAGVSSVI